MSEKKNTFIPWGIISKSLLARGLPHVGCWHPAISGKIDTKSWKIHYEFHPLLNRSKN